MERPVLSVLELAVAMIILLGVLFFWVAQITMFSNANIYGGSNFSGKDHVNVYSDGPKGYLDKLDLDYLFNNSYPPLIVMDGNEFYTYVLGKHLESANQAKFGSGTKANENAKSTLNEFKEYLIVGNVAYAIENSESLRWIDKNISYMLHVIQPGQVLDNTSDVTNMPFEDDGIYFTWVTRAH